MGEYENIRRLRYLFAVVVAVAFISGNLWTAAQRSISALPFDLVLLLLISAVVLPAVSVRLLAVKRLVNLAFGFMCGAAGLGLLGEIQVVASMGHGVVMLWAAGLICSLAWVHALIMRSAGRSDYMAIIAVCWLLSCVSLLVGLNVAALFVDALGRFAASLFALLIGLGGLGMRWPRLWDQDVPGRLSRRLLTRPMLMRWAVWSVVLLMLLQLGDGPRRFSELVVGAGLGALLGLYWNREHPELGLLPLAVLLLACAPLAILGCESLPPRWVSVLLGGVVSLSFLPLLALQRIEASEHAAARALLEGVGLAVCSAVTLLLFTALEGLQQAWAATLLAVLLALWVLRSYPWSATRLVLLYLTKKRHRVHVQGVNNIPDSGGVLLLANHISWLDWAVIQIGCARPVRFVRPLMAHQQFSVRLLHRFTGSIYVNAASPSAEDLSAVADALRQGDVVCAFPEGTTSRIGHLGRFRSTFEKVLEQVTDDVAVIPVYLRGLTGTARSTPTNGWRQQRPAGVQRELIVAFGPQLERSITADRLKSAIFDLSITSWQQFLRDLPTLPQAWLQTAKRKRSRVVLADTLSEPLSAYRMMTAAICMSRHVLAKVAAQRVGILMPTSAGGVLINMATALAGKTIVNLNYTASEQALRGAISSAEITTVYTSRQFLQRLAQRGLDWQPLLDGCVEVIYLEDVKAGMRKLELLGTLLAVVLLPTALLARWVCRANDSAEIAAILFSSGSEGTPKGVMLSHRNLMANLKQVSYVLNAQESDVVMASLPLFHAFGLTATQFMPLIEGLPMVCHADPTDAQAVGQAVARYQATLLFGTSTFFRLYSRSPKVHPLMFDSLRLVVAGAEKLSPDVRDMFEARFNRRLIEGYGATETSPVAGVNLPDVLDTNHWTVQVGSKIGTVGMPLPGSSYKIVDPETGEELPTGSEGMILIGGLQVMEGYLNDPDKTAEVIEERDGVRWYRTGDKGYVDSDGFLTIVDRYSRFAKLGGEMVSLGRVELLVKAALESDDVDVIAVNVADAQKGERIVLLADSEIDLRDLRRRMLASNCSNLEIPAQCFLVETMPKLGSGKTDFSAARKLAEALLQVKE